MQRWQVGLDCKSGSKDGYCERLVLRGLGGKGDHAIQGFVALTWEPLWGESYLLLSIRM